MVIILSLAAFFATLLGGLFALRFKDKLHLILSFSAGAIIAVAFFDLLPEAIELAGAQYPISVPTAVVGLGFAFFMVLDRVISLHAHSEDGGGHEHRGKLGAASLSLHSFLDGLAIGLAFQISQAIGLVVATAVLVHDFSDGINTVNLILKNKGNSKLAFRWLLLDASAPMAGAFSTLFFSLPEAQLGLVLATFCGFFLYIGASDLLPESYHNHPTHWATFMTLLGMLVLYGAVKIAGI
jgi:zinc transporter ZupT